MLLIRSTCIQHENPRISATIPAAFNRNDKSMTTSNPAGLELIPDLGRSPTIDQVGVEERIDRLTKRSIKKESKVFALKLALSMIDLTTLEGADTPGKVKQLCYKAKHLHEAAPGGVRALPDLPHVGAVCVYPELVAI